MAVVFEDKFMEVQSDMVSLALELAAEEAIDKIYLYASIENESVLFNAFYSRGMNILKLSDVEKSKEKIRAFLRLGTDDVEQLVSVCKSYQKPIPTEIKAIYDADKNSFDSNYQFSTVGLEEKGKSPGVVFLEWRDMVQFDLQKG